MRLHLRLAWRNVWRHRRRSVIVVLAIGLTMAMMMFYDGLVTGFEQAIYGNAIRVLGGNLQVHAEGYAASLDRAPLLPLPDDRAPIEAALAQPQVTAASRRIVTGGLASNRTGAFAVSIVGLEPELELPVNLVAQKVASGRFLKADDQDVVYIGRGLAEAMEVQVGDRITLAGRATHSQMRQRTLTVVGIYDVGLADIEKRSAYVSLAEAQALYGLEGQSTEIIITLEAIGQEGAVQRALRPALAGYEITAWDANFPELASAMRTKGGAMNIFSVIILLVVGISLLNLLLMAVYERTREIGLLGALGFRPGQISWLFLLEGVLMGLMGVAMGVSLGLLINVTLGRVGMDYTQFTSLTEYMALISGRIYPSLGLEKLPGRTLTVVIISLLASFYPARQAARREPAEALHYV